MAANNEAAERLDRVKAGFRSIEPATIEDWVRVDGKWHILTYVWDANDLLPTLYVDGVQPHGRGETAYWDRALSADEIRTIYEAGKVDQL